MRDILRRLPTVAIVVVAALVGGCDDDPVGVGDPVVDGATGLDQYVLSDGGLDLDALLRDDSLVPDADLPGEYLDRCEDAEDCVSGYCVPDPEGVRVCSQRCANNGDCAEGFECTRDNNSGADVTFICVARREVLCLPCATDGDCGSGAHLCLPIGRSNYCAKDCTRSDCPEGFTCTDIPGDDGESKARQCLPDVASCRPCVDADGDGYGVGEDCLGFDCNDEDVNTYEGAPEICDGEDNDCNSIPDDGLTAPDEFTCLAVGVCADTEPACRVGEWTCPYPEDRYEADAELSCDGEDNDCDDVVDEDFELSLDPNNCGACGQICAFGQAEALCRDAGCVLGDCDVGFWDADGLSVNGCEYACAQTNEAVEACDEIDNDCDGLADEDYDLQSDIANCGACNVRCAYAQGTASCQDATCILEACVEGWVDANGNPEDGCELACVPSNDGVEACDEIDNNCDGRVDETFELLSDVSNCGVCGNVCAYANAAPICDNSQCAMAACNPGWWDIDGRSDNGCEYQCEPSNGGVELCDEVDNDCDGAIDDGFDLASDAINCGRCGQVCEFSQAGAICLAGACAMADCLPGFVDADGAAANGCEYECTPTEDPTEICDEIDNNCDGRVDEGFDLQTDIDHCGGCGQACAPENATGECVEGGCTIDACDEGFYDLDDDVEGGCEYTCVMTNEGQELCDEIDNNCDGAVDEAFDLQTDGINCGRCGTVCAFDFAGAECAAGSCQMTGCDDAHWNIDGATENGCEYACQITLGGAESCDEIDNNCDGAVDEGFDLLTDLDNCGVCGNRCEYDNGFGACQAGECAMIGCAVGFLDFDADSSNGCEFGCQPSNGGVEICDGIDNDCDRLTDEDFDLVADASNCGRCGNQCAFDNARAVCQDRSCRQAECNPGFVDVNGLSEDGCEYACVPSAGGVEVCDTVDNNCDGVVDEGFQLNIDVSNCGGCGNQCVYTNALPLCLNGGCAMGQCQLGFWDIDRDPSTGCEYACEVTNNGVETCDGLDNNCDGTVDEGFDLQSSLIHCGGCNTACTTTDAVPICNAGNCEIDRCNDGFVDLDADPANGCEYACALTNDGVERCDDVDNDCDGATDETFDTNTDLANCGGCNQACTLPNSVMQCAAGDCNFVACDPGFFDLDGAPGCEYRCDFIDAVDLPDPNGVDANCDGVDGEIGKAIFLKPGPNNGNGTMNAPYNNLGSAMVASILASPQRYIIASEGLYSNDGQPFDIASGMKLYGGYQQSGATRWLRSPDFESRFVGGTKGMTVRNLNTATLLDQITIVSTNNVAVGGSSYGLWVSQSGDFLTTRGVSIEAGDGGNGGNGSGGATGRSGNPGGRGSNGCDSSTLGVGGCNQNGGGGGNARVCVGGGTSGAGGGGGRSGSGSGDGANGGSGGAGVIAGGSGGGGGAGRTNSVRDLHWNGCRTHDGAAGAPGASGVAGSRRADGAGGGPVGTGGAEYSPSVGANGLFGRHGGGGGGGGGAGGTDCTVGCCLDDVGGAGGGGGSGGCGGGAGARGDGGGGSFAVWLNGSNGQLHFTRLTVGDGGNGGRGGNGGGGGSGGAGAGGGNGFEIAKSGGAGAAGRFGGAGSHGGGGGGGPSIGVAMTNAQPALSVGSYVLGLGGSGGASSGNAGTAGMRANTRQF